MDTSMTTNTTFLPSFLVRFLQTVQTPEFWKKVLELASAAALILLFFLLLEIILHRVLRRTMTRQKDQLLRKTLRYTAWIIAIVTVLQGAGVNLTALLGAAGIAGIAVGFAAQTSISNLISGVFLISEKPFQVGDVIQVGDVTGTVLSIDLLSVKIQTFDNRFVRIPNESIIKTNVINNTRFPIRRLDIWITVSYNTDLQKVAAVLKDLAARNLYALGNPEPFIFFDKYDVSGINVLFGVWYEQSKFVDLKNSILSEIQARFGEEGIVIPYPKRDVYIRGVTELGATEQAAVRADVEAPNNNKERN
ncbi:MAG TPA: mechanosensitive ion channel family protein [Spirochaetales bacterium]|mgnify:CR=1 FL=1|nr:mechanosensitive ion channel family protein [Spirochaetales bacterium]